MHGSRPFSFKFCARSRSPSLARVSVLDRLPRRWHSTPPVSSSPKASTISFSVREMHFQPVVSTTPSLCRVESGAKRAGGAKRKRAGSARYAAGESGACFSLRWVWGGNKNYLVTIKCIRSNFRRFFEMLKKGEHKESKINGWRK